MGLPQDLIPYQIIEDRVRGCSVTYDYVLYDVYFRLDTCDSTMITKLNKLIESSPNTYVITRQEKEGVFVKFPKKLLSLRRPVTKEKTPEQLAIAKERMRKML